MRLVNLLLWGTRSADSLCAVGRSRQEAPEAKGRVRACLVHTSHEPARECHYVLTTSIIPDNGSQLQVDDAWVKRMLSSPCMRVVRIDTTATELK